MITVNPDAAPLSSTEKSSAIIIQGIGPKPMEKETMNKTKQTKGSQPTEERLTPFSCTLK